MHPRTLALWAPLLALASAAQAEATGATAGYQEGAPVAVAFVTATPTKAYLAPREAQPTRTSAVPVPVKAPAASKEPNAPRDIKALLALVGGLAMVGWIQRRRPDA